MEAKSMIRITLLLLPALVEPHGAHDVTLGIAMGREDRCRLSFASFGAEGGEFSLINAGRGTLELQQFSTPRLTISMGAPPPSSSSFVEEAGGAAASAQPSLPSLPPSHHVALRQRKLRMESGAALMTSQALSRSRRRLLHAAAPAAPPLRLAERIAVPSTLTVSGAVASTAAGSVLAHGVHQWKMVMHDDFHHTTVEAWRNLGAQRPLPPNNAVTTCAAHRHALSDTFLGDYGAMEASKAFLLPAHAWLRVEARVHFLDKWEGESVYLKIDGQVVWSERWTWCDKLLVNLCVPGTAAAPTATIDSCGREYPDRLSFPLIVTLFHSGEELELSFGSTLAANTTDASWGVDDLRLSLR